MCGIWAVFGGSDDMFTHCKAAFKIAHRGPDAFRLESINQFPSCCLGFHRLAILDAQHGMQPMRVSRHPHIWLIYNGEIYNHLQLREQFGFHCDTQCDGESIIHLYVRGGIEFATKHMDGVFAFCLLDTDSGKVYLGRDTFGVKPLFRILMEDGFLSVCSEVKGLMDIVRHHTNVKIHDVLPGHVETFSLNKKGQASFENMKQFHRIGDAPSYRTAATLKGDFTMANIRTLLENAVRKRMMSERRIGCLLSGGLDSSLITALLVKLARERDFNYPIQTFSIGMYGSPDLAAAKLVAKHLGTEHHEIVFTHEEAISTIDDVIYYLESYDALTIRGAVGMYLMCKYVKENTDTTILLSGEGSDEITQGYCHFHRAPSAKDGDKESRRLCKDISLFDVRRVDRNSAAFGLEIRVPFLDHQFSSYYLSLDPDLKAPKNGIEKQLLRSAFNDTGLLPADILWRPKEAFADGIASPTKSWIECIKDFVADRVNNSELEFCRQKYSHNPPLSNESLYYRRIFEKHYSGQSHLIPYPWTPKWSPELSPGKSKSSVIQINQSNDENM